MSTKIFLLTPIGVASYPYLTKPDTKFGNKYHTKLTFDATAGSGAEFAQQLEDLAEKHFQQCLSEAQKGKRIKKADLPFINNGDGTITVIAKLNAEGINGKTQQAFTQRPVIYDEKNRTWDLNTGIFSGFELRLQVEVVQYNTPTLGAGVSLRLKAVKVEKRVERGVANPFGAPQEEQEENPFGAQCDGSTSAPPEVSSGGYDEDGNGDF